MQNHVLTRKGIMMVSMVRSIYQCLNIFCRQYAFILKKCYVCIMCATMGQVFVCCALSFITKNK